MGVNIPGYVHSRYDAEIDMSATSGAGSTPTYSPALTQTHFQITAPQKNGDIYVQVDLYPLGTLPKVCRDGSFATTTKFGAQVSYTETNVPIVYVGVFDSQQNLANPSTSAITPQYGAKYYQAYRTQSVFIPESAY